MKKSNIVSVIAAISLASTMAFAFVGCGDGGKSSSASTSAKSYEEAAQQVKSEEDAHLENAANANANGTETAAVGEAIDVTSAEGDFAITIDEALINKDLKYADDQVACVLYYTVNNISCDDSEIDLRDLMLVSDDNGDAVKAQPDSRASENPGKTSAPNAMADCPMGDTIEFATYYAVPADSTTITVAVGGKTIIVPLTPAEN